MSSMKGIKSDIVCHLEQERSIVDYKVGNLSVSQSRNNNNSFIYPF